MKTTAPTPIDPTTGRMYSGTFDAINMQQDGLAKSMRVTGSNGNLAEFLDEREKIAIAHGTTIAAFNQEVNLRKNDTKAKASESAPKVVKIKPPGAPSVPAHDAPELHALAPALAVLATV